MQKTKYILYTLMSLSIPIIVIKNPAFATTMDTNVNIRPSMTLSVSTDNVSLTLDPATKSFDTKDLTISIGTNNPTGYKLYLNADNTNLVNIADSTKTIETLPSSTPATGYDQSSFPVNYWGYRKTNGSTSSGNYFPYASELLVSSSSGPTNETTTTIGLASKIDYLKASGTYRLNFSLNAIPTITQYYMQDLSDPTLASSVCVTEHPTIVFDSRDEQAYTIRRINGTCWMIDNLRLGFNRSNPNITEINLTTNDSDVLSSKKLTLYDLVNYGQNNAECYGDAGYTNPCIHSYYEDTNGSGVGVWYNYAAASAGSIIGKNNDNTANESICPFGWSLPSKTKMVELLSEWSLFNYLVFHPGDYQNGTLIDGENIHWFSSEASTTSPLVNRIRLNYHKSDNILSTGVYGTRNVGQYVRCILK